MGANHRPSTISEANAIVDIKSTSYDLMVEFLHVKLLLERLEQLCTGILDVVVVFVE